MLKVSPQAYLAAASATQVDRKPFITRDLSRITWFAADSLDRLSKSKLNVVQSANRIVKENHVLSRFSHFCIRGVFCNMHNEKIR